MQRGTQMSKRAQGRVALVTGGARGIGEATAARLAEDGAAIAICDLDLDAAEAAAARIAAGDFHLGPEHAQRPCSICAFRPICPDRRP